MFDGILGRGFAPKGKPLIKLTKNRIDVLRRKRTATIKFLKKDLVDLVINGLDVNAYNRAGGLLDELRLLWNLDFVEKTCDFVYRQLSTMQKKAECPEDCREAVSSLMFAASGFSELPELRELRQMFHEKYADSLGLFVNHELVENMSSKPFSLEKKVKLMEDVASEFSIHWDSKAFEKKITRHNSSSVKETPKSTYDGHKPVDGRRDPLFQPDNEFYQNGHRGNQHVTSKERSVRTENKGNKAERKEFHVQPKQEPFRERHQPIFNEGDTIVMKLKRENLDQGNGHRNGVVDTHKKTETIASERKEFHMQSKQEPSRVRHQPIFNEGDTIVMKVKRENGHQNGLVDAHKKIEDIVSEKPKSSSTKRADKLVIGFKQESFYRGYKHEDTPQKVEDDASKPPKPSSKSKRTEPIDSSPIHRNERVSRENAVLVGENSGKDQSDGNIKGSEYEHDLANQARRVEERETEKMKSSVYKSLPPPYVKPSGKPRAEKSEASVYPKTRFDGEEGTHPEKGNEVNEVDNPSQKRRTSRRKHIIQSGGDDNTRSQRSENSRKGLQVLVDENEKDSEEKIMDKLLMHYSKKPSSYEKSQVREESKSRRTHRKKDEEHEEMMIPQPARSRSLPSEQFAGPSEPPTKMFARASSFQPERSDAKHVHPKLPDYDDLAARFADLKGR